jgi:hypothetical protein
MRENEGDPVWAMSQNELVKPCEKQARLAATEIFYLIAEETSAGEGTSDDRAISIDTMTAIILRHIQ